MMLGICSCYMAGVTGRKGLSSRLQPSRWRLHTALSLLVAIPAWPSRRALRVLGSVRSPRNSEAVTGGILPGSPAVSQQQLTADLLHGPTALHHGTDFRTLDTVSVRCPGVISVLQARRCCTDRRGSSTVLRHETRPGFQQRRHREDD